VSRPFYSQVKAEGTSSVRAMTFPPVPVPGSWGFVSREATSGIGDTPLGNGYGYGYEGV
jgi:hypothetical protein